MTDQVEISRADTGSHTHIRGFYGDGGENESVLSVVVHTAGHPHYPETGRIFVGSPKESPLIDGHLAELGAFSCSAEAAVALIGVLATAVSDVRKAQHHAEWTATIDRRLTEACLLTLVDAAAATVRAREAVLGTEQRPRPMRKSRQEQVHPGHAVRDCRGCQDLRGHGDGRYRRVPCRVRHSGTA